MFNLFKVKIVINFFYKLKLFKIIKIYNVFHFKFLNFAVINLLSNLKKNSITINKVSCRNEVFILRNDLSYIET